MQLPLAPPTYLDVKPWITSLFSMATMIWPEPLKFLQTFLCNCSLLRHFPQWQCAWFWQERMCILSISKISFYSAVILMTRNRRENEGGLRFPGRIKQCLKEEKYYRPTWKNPACFISQQKKTSRVLWQDHLVHAPNNRYIQSLFNRESNNLFKIGFDSGKLKQLTANKT